TWSPLGYRAVRHLATLLRVAGNVSPAGPVGSERRGIRWRSATSGLALARGEPTGPGLSDTLLAGYPAPAVVGLAGAWLLGRGFAAGTLWALVLLCAVMLLFIRNFYGLWVVLVTGVGVGALSWLATGTVISIAAYLMVWGLL